MKFLREKFYELKKKNKISEIIKAFPNFIKSYEIKLDHFITDISSLNSFKEDSFLFIKQNYKSSNLTLDNITLIFDSESIYATSKNQNKLLVNDIDQFYITIVNYLFSHEDSFDHHDEFLNNNSSKISKYSIIDDSSVIGQNCFIGKGVKIGKNCIIKNNVIIKNAILSDDIIVGDNTVIGSTGFGFNLNQMGSKNVLPHIGIVYIDSNVSIGSSCTIDRGKIDCTFIGKNSMIDNLVHIAHNVSLGENACIAAQTGISGSVVIGKNLIAGGQSGFAGHITIGDNVVVAAKSGVTKDITSNSTVAGFPAIDINKWKKNIIRERKNGYK